MAIIPINLGGGGGADTSVVTATAADVLAGKVFVDANGDAVNGTIEVYDGTVYTPVGAKPTNLAPTAVYTGEVITNGYTTPNNVTMTGNNSGTTAGTYTAVYTPNATYCWSDGTVESVTVVLTITES